jgi:hypothetical protein
VINRLQKRKWLIKNLEKFIDESNFHRDHKEDFIMDIAASVPLEGEGGSFEIT